MIGSIVAYSMVNRAVRRVFDDKERKYESVSQFTEIKGVTQHKVLYYN